MFARGERRSPRRMLIHDVERSSAERQEAAREPERGTRTTARDAMWDLRLRAARFGDELRVARHADDVATILWVRVVSSFSADWAGLWLACPGRAAWEIVRRLDLPESLSNLGASSGGVFAAMRQGELIAFDTRAALERFDPALGIALPRAHDVAILAAPLVGQRGPLGCALLGFEGPREFGRAELEHLVILARRAALSIERARHERPTVESAFSPSGAGRDEILALTAHELSTPLGALRLALEGMERSVDLDASHRLRRLGMCLRQVDWIETLVLGLLDVARLDQRGGDGEPEVVEMTSLVSAVLSRMQETRLSTSSEVVWRPAAPVVGRWNRMRVEQIVTNLVANAFKYGRGKPVTVAVGSDGSTAVLRVSDEGVGIAAADLDRIFERFERAGDRGAARGVGLGLWIVRRLVESMGGKVSATSVLGRGSSFVVELPAEPSPADVRDAGELSR